MFRCREMGAAFRRTRAGRGFIGSNDWTQKGSQRAAPGRQGCRQNAGFHPVLATPHQASKEEMSRRASRRFRTLLWSRTISTSNAKSSAQAATKRVMSTLLISLSPNRTQPVPPCPADSRAASPHPMTAKGRLRVALRRREHDRPSWPREDPPRRVARPQEHWQGQRQ